jgi:flagellar basal-body rod protein FlgB
LLVSPGSARRTGAIGAGGSTMISKLFSSGSMQAVERLIQFTGARHKVLTNNIANFETPYYRARDLDPKAFQAGLRDAIESRRSGSGSSGTKLQMRDTRQIRFTDEGIEVRPGFDNSGVTFHDRTNADVERTMQHLAENTMAHNAGLQILKSEFDLLKMAIRGRS